MEEAVAVRIGSFTHPGSRLTLCYGSHVRKLPNAARSALVALAWATVPLTVLLSKQSCSVATVFHRPCPGCGLTRATLLMMHGHVGESLTMHPLAVPMIACWAAIALATIRATWRDGVPWFFFRERFGRLAVYATSVAYVALIALWALREFGFCGGRVPIG